MERLKAFQWQTSSQTAQPVQEPASTSYVPAAISQYWRNDVQADNEVRTTTDSSEAFLALSRWERFLAFLLCTAGAAACFLIAFLTIPVLALKPRKFAVAFTFGSLLFMFGFAILQGPTTQMQHLLSRERLPFTLTYGLSMGLTLFFAVGRKAYLPTILCAVLQVIALVVYFITYFPGGISTLRLGGRIALRGASNILPV